MDDQTLLDLVNAQIAALLSGGAVKSWREGNHLVEHMSIVELYGLRTELENKIAEAAGGMLMPIREVDV